MRIGEAVDDELRTRLQNPKGLSPSQAADMVEHFEDISGVRLAVKEAAKVVVPNGESVYLVQRSDDMSSYQGKWEHVGGGQDLGEKPKKALRREGLEETGRIIYRPRYFGTYFVIDQGRVNLDCGNLSDVRIRAVLIHNYVGSILHARNAKLSIEHQRGLFRKLVDLDRSELAGITTSMAIEHVTGFKIPRQLKS